MSFKEKTVIDLETTDSNFNQNFIDSYSNVNINTVFDDGNEKSRHRTPETSFIPGASDFGQAVASQVWVSGTEKAKKYASIYGNIDILRPYFDVEPRTVMVRLARAFVPIWKQSRSVDLPQELYGPSMLNFTLVALLLYSMKSASHTIQDGTLIGTAMGVCFGYWLIVSSVVFFFNYIYNCSLSFIQVLSLIGYALIAPCVIVLLSTIFHPVHDHMFFYSLWFLLGGLTSSRLATVCASTTEVPSHRLTMMALPSLCHMLFMLYLHFAYHSTAQQVQTVINTN